MSVVQSFKNLFLYMEQTNFYPQKLGQIVQNWVFFFYMGDPRGWPVTPLPKYVPSCLINKWSQGAGGAWVDNFRKVCIFSCKFLDFFHFFWISSIFFGYLLLSLKMMRTSGALMQEEFELTTSARFQQWLHLQQGFSKMQSMCHWKEVTVSREFLINYDSCGKKNSDPFLLIYLSGKNPRPL